MIKEFCKPLVFSCLLFLIPLFFALNYKMYYLAGAFGLLVVTSIFNHSKLFIPLANYIDQVVVQIISVVLSILAFFVIAPREPLLGISAGSCGIAAGLIYKFKNHTGHHVLLHIVGALGFTLYVVGMHKLK